jgi:hypothetical protein
MAWKLIMNADSLQCLQEIFSADISIPTSFDADALKQNHVKNIASDLVLAVNPQRHPRLRAAPEPQQETHMPKQKREKPVATRKQGKFAYIKSLLTQATFTRQQIIEAAAKQFPHWDIKLVECGVYSARTQLRRDKLPGDWLPETPEPVTPKEAVAVAVATAQERDPVADESEPPRIVAATKEQMSGAEAAA